MKKPSTRVKEWVVFFRGNRPKETDLENHLSAIIQVMDEEYEAEEKRWQDEHADD